MDIMFAYFCTVFAVLGVATVIYLSKISETLEELVNILKEKV